MAEGIFTNYTVLFTNEDMRRFITENSGTSTDCLRLRHHRQKFSFDLDFALTQIDARRKAKGKLPHFISSIETVFPDSLSFEQSTNEAVAAFHASLIPAESSVIDLTAGLGIDSLAISSVARNVISIELNELKAEALRYNSRILHHDNITVVNHNSIDWLSKSDINVDIAFIDPARRSQDKRRVFLLSECTPDVTSVADMILSHARRLIVKASPLLDISSALSQLPSIKHIYVVCFKGECKEVLLDITPGTDLQMISAVDLNNDGIVSRINFSPSASSQIKYIEPFYSFKGKYLYEPNAAVMKIGMWNELHRLFPGLNKVCPNTHLFFSDTLYKDFPGRIMAVDDILDKSKRHAIKGAPFNIVSRNYHLTSDQLRKKLKTTDGGHNFIYAFRTDNKGEGMMLSCIPQNLTPHDRTT